MGPFELMDLVGVDTGFEISKSFYSQSFGEPRWRPSMIAARYVAAGLHGRKSGRGYYDYGALAETGAYREADPEPLRGAGRQRRGCRRDQRRERAGGRAASRRRSGRLRGARPARAERWRAALADRRMRPRPADSPDRPRRRPRRRRRVARRVCSCARTARSPRSIPAGSAVGFHVLPPFDEARLVELTRSESSSPLAAERAERFLAGARQAPRLGRRRTRPGARTDRLPDHQRVGLRARRRRRRRRGHRHWACCSG